MFPRWFGNKNQTRKFGGTLEENGCGKFDDLDARVLRRIRDLGVTHLWLTGAIRHATQTDYAAFDLPRQHSSVVKGKAGSPYAIADYYDVCPDLATNVAERMAEFEALVSRIHKADMQVVLDFVPNHVAREYKSVCKPDNVRDLGEGDNPRMHFSTHNNFYYLWEQPLQLPGNATDGYTEQPAKATGNDQFSAQPTANDWYETVKLNYGIDYCDAGGRSEHFTPVPDTWRQMLDILLFWAAKGVDSFRCDMVFMVPVPFWQWAISQVKTAHPHVTFIGEIYDPWLYRSYIAAGFDWLYDKVGMYDCLFAVTRGQRASSDITRQWQSVDDIGDHMLYFLENHDELRIASDFFAGDGRRGRPAAIVSSLLGRSPFMLYAGQEFGERGMEAEGFSGYDGRTTIFDYWSVDTVRRGYYFPMHLTKAEKQLHQFYRQLLSVANGEKAVSEGQMFDLMYCNGQSWRFDANRQYAFLRKAGEELLLIVANFSDNDVECGVTIPQHAFDFLQMVGQDMATATDLLSKDVLTTPLKADEAVQMMVPAWGGRVYKFHLTK